MRGVAVEQPPQRAGTDERVVGIQDRNLSGAEMLDRLQCRMGGAEPIMLNDADVRFGFFPNRIHLGAENDNDALKDRFAACQQVAQHGPAGQTVQRLRQGRLHSCAKAGGQNDCGCLHTRPLLR